MNAYPVRVSTKSGLTFTTYAINDPCSSSNILAKELKEALNLKGESRVISWDTAIARADLLTENVQLAVEDIQGTDSFDLHFEVMDLSHLKELNTPVKDDVSQFPQVKHLIGYEPQIPYVTVVIGACNHDLHIPSEIYRSNTGLTLFRVPLGFVFFGPTKKQTGISNTSVQVNFINIRETQEQLKDIWNDDEHLDMYDPQKYPSFEDRKAIEIMKSSITKENGRFIVRQPWKSIPPELPDNRFIVQRRFSSLMRKFRKDPSYFEEYKEAIEKYIHAGHAERVPDD